MKTVENLLARPYVKVISIVGTAVVLVLVGYQVGDSVGEFIWNILH